MSAAQAAVDAQAEVLRRFALSYPESHEDHPWGETAIKVRKKVFLFLGAAGRLSLSVKLPRTGLQALLLACAEPTGYGLGKHGWVTARFEPDEVPPVEMLVHWVHESFVAVAPKRVSKALPEDHVARFLATL